MGASTVHDRLPMNVAERCAQMREDYEVPSKDRPYLKEMARKYQVHHSTILYHVNRKCKCFSL